jgi:hypothetical protein
MFAVDHAATALLIKRRYPAVTMTPLLLSVQAMELAWVGLNYLGVERTIVQIVTTLFLVGALSAPSTPRHQGFAGSV